MIKTQINAGKLFIGESAGAILLAPDIEYVKDTDDPLVAPQLKTFEALKDVYKRQGYRCTFRDSGRSSLSGADSWNPERCQRKPGRAFRTDPL